MLELGSRAVNAARNLPPLSPGGDASAGTLDNATRYQLQVLGQEVEIASPLVGRHQLRNLALAITAAEELAAMGYRITAESIARGVRQTEWPGRFQRFAATAAHPEIVIDVAHNPAGAWALRAALSQHYEGRRMVLLFAAMADKAVEQMAQILWPQMEQVVLTRVAGNPRAAQVAELAILADTLGVRHSVASTVPEAVQLAILQARELDEDALLVVAGSIYLAGEALPLLQEGDAKS
jgi:dihydrofolate synthase/folylpolyglutamate synthase